MIMRVLMLAAVLGVAACATPTPYGPAVSPGGYGYAEQRIEPTRFRVSFAGNSLTDLETVETFLLYRAAELTLQNGYDWFTIADRDTESESRLVGTGYSGVYGPHYSGFYHRYYHPGYGWYPWYDPFWANSVNYREVTRYEASAEIVFGRGPRPAADPRAYDAREVERNLAAEVRASQYSAY